MTVCVGVAVFVCPRGGGGVCQCVTVCRAAESYVLYYQTIMCPTVLSPLCHGQCECIAGGTFLHTKIAISSSTLLEMSHSRCLYNRLYSSGVMHAVPTEVPDTIAAVPAASKDHDFKSSTASAFAPCSGTHTNGGEGCVKLVVLNRLIARRLEPRSDFTMPESRSTTSEVL